MRVLNPTGWHVTGISRGVTYELPPFSVVHIWDEFDAEHIALRNAKDKGIVLIEPDSAQRLKFSQNPNDFLKTQAIQGLKNLQKKLDEDYTNELQAERDSKDKTGTEADRRHINPKKFETAIKDAEVWMKELESEKWSPAKYLKNEIRRQDEPWDYSNESTKKTG